MWRVGLKRFSSRFYSSGSQPGKPGKIGMKQLVKEYGWTATGVYLALSAIDLPLTFGVVHSAGQTRLENWEIAVRKTVGANSDRESTFIHRAASGGKSLLWTELGIAYIIHKSLLVFVRVPLTVAITPPVARKLGQWGFKVGRAVPAVDKEQLAYKVANTARNTNYEAVRKTAERVSKELNSNPKQVLHDAAKATKVVDQAAKSGDKATKVANQTARTVLEKTERDFGSKPSQRRKWFWFF